MPLPTTYRTPWVALTWSAMLPGLGQLYNHDYLVAILLLILEIGINFFSCLNCAILSEFRTSFPHAIKPDHLQWILFYPSIYAFSMWHALNRSIEINQSLKKQGVELTTPPKLTGLFIAFCIGMLFGIIWPYNKHHILTGLAGGIAGMPIGYVLEKALHSRE